MKPVLIRISIYLNVILFFTVGLLIYKLGLFDELVVSSSPIVRSLHKIVNTAPQPLTDTLVTDPGWQSTVRQQVLAIQGHRYDSCIFGDSVTAALGKSMGPSAFNFALGGMSTISLVEQLKVLTAAKLKCSKVVIAIGANDAWDTMSDQTFSTKMAESIALARQTQPKQIILIPAFYSTVAASHDPTVSATNERVDEINALMSQVATRERVPIAFKSVESLNQNHAWKEKLSDDGVHLNEDGLAVYRLALLRLLNLDCYLDSLP